ncbi:MAG TPA: hypothetical protein VFW37_04085 [Alphaproteobacteria bacterium]|nr:hypothetical protein [Alphaproteobacteria bacterium]
MKNIADAGKPTATIHRLRKTQPQAYKYDLTRRFIDYWFSLPRLGLVPQKSSIEPRKMLNMLPGAIMLEKNPGADYLNFTPPQHSADILNDFSKLNSFPCGLVICSDELYTSGQIVRTEMVLFPFRTNEADQSILFGVITAEPDHDIMSDRDILATLNYWISSVNFINIGAGIPD